jgi:hypothetical protein
VWSKGCALGQRKRRSRPPLSAPNARHLRHGGNGPGAEVVPRTHWAWGALVAAIVVGKLPLAPEEWPYPNRVLSRQTLAQWVRQHLPPDAKLAPIVEDDAPARRRGLSRLLYGLW